MNILSAPIAAKVAIAVFAGAIVMGGAAAASAAVNEVITEVASGDETPVVDETSDPVVVDDGEDDGDDDGDGKVVEATAPGNSAWGHCNARSHGGLPSNSTAGAALDAAADGDVEAYCATITKGADDEADDGDQSEADDSETGDDDSADATTTEKEHGKSGGHGKGHGHGKH